MPTVDDTDTTERPTSSEMRAPESSRARMSRPSSSSPNGCARRRRLETPRQLLRRRIVGRRATARPAPRPAIASDDDRRRRRRIIIEADPRIEQPVGQIGEQVHQHVGDGDEQDAALHQRVVAEADRLDQQPADAGPREDRLGDDRAGQHRAELQADDRDDRNQAVAERVAHDGAQPRQPARARGEHVELAQLLEQARARHPRQDRRQRGAERDGRQHEMRQAVPVPATGSQPSWTANRIASSGPSQKFGIEMPTSASVIAA